MSVWECSDDVTGDTASSNNPAGMFATRAHFRFCSDGLANYGIRVMISAVQVAFSQIKKSTIIMCETRAIKKKKKIKNHSH